MRIEDPDTASPTKKTDATLADISLLLFGLYFNTVEDHQWAAFQELNDASMVASSLDCVVRDLRDSGKSFRMAVQDYQVQLQQEREAKAVTELTYEQKMDSYMQKLEGAKNRRERKLIQAAFSPELENGGEGTAIKAWGEKIISPKKKPKVIDSTQDKVLNPVTGTFVDRADYERALKPDTRDPNTSDRHKFSQRKHTQVLSKNQKLNSINMIDATSPFMK